MLAGRAGTAVRKWDSALHPEPCTVTFTSMRNVKKRRRGATTISSKHQITIPAAELRAAGLEAGERLVARADGPGRVVEPVKMLPQSENTPIVGSDSLKNSVSVEKTVIEDRQLCLFTGDKPAIDIYHHTSYFWPFSYIFPADYLPAIRRQELMNPAMRSRDATGWRWV